MFMDFMMERMWFELLKANRERDCRERQEKENKTNAIGIYTNGGI